MADFQRAQNVHESAGQELNLILALQIRGKSELVSGRFAVFNVCALNAKKTQFFYCFFRDFSSVDEEINLCI